MRKPNILWICTDQQRFDTLGCNGNKWVHTPNLDSFSDCSVNLKHMYVQSPVCAPSRASFLSGRYPRTCGIRQNGQDIPSRELLLPKVFSENGYVCGLSGKLHLSACHHSVCPDMERRIDDGYSFFSWSHNPARAGKNNWTCNEYTNWLTSIGVEYKTEPLAECRYVDRGMPAEYSQTRWCFDEAIRFIDAQDPDQPWLFSLNCYDPHHAFDPPAEYLDRYLERLDEIPLPDYIPGELEQKSLFQQHDHDALHNKVGSYPYDSMTKKDHRYITAAYWAMVDQIDDNVGRILQFLKDTGRYEDTIIIFMSDHGESLGDHGIYLKGPNLYESAVHVPFLIHWEKHFPEGKALNALIEMLDLAPTLCEAAGIDIPESFQGRSFLKLLCDIDAEDKHRDSVYTEFYNSNANHKNPCAFLTMVSNGEWKLVKTHTREDEPEIASELYNLKNDPGEHVNLYGNPLYLEKQAEMLALMTDRMAQTLDPLPVRKAFW